MYRNLINITSMLSVFLKKIALRVKIKAMSMYNYTSNRLKESQYWLITIW